MNGPAGNPYRRSLAPRPERPRPVPGDPGWGRGLTSHTVIWGGKTERTAATGTDPDLDRLVGMGFRPNEVTKAIAKARAEGEPDVIRYVLGMVIQGVARR